MTDTIRIPAKALSVFAGRARWRGMKGGRGSGKSVAAGGMALIRAVGHAARGGTGIALCARQFQNSLGDSALATLKSVLADAPDLASRFDIGHKYLRTKDRRVEFAFRGLDRNLGSLKSLHGVFLAWVEEAEFVSEDAWRMLIPTVRQPGSEIWATWNPASPQSPVHRRLVVSPPPSCRVAELNWRDNPWFPDVLVQEMLDDWKKRPEDAGHIWEGEFRVAWEGSFWGEDMRRAGLDGRIGEFPIMPGVPVHAAADLGARVNNPFWLFQVEQRDAGQAARLRVVGFYEPEAETLEAWRDGLVARGWNGNLYLPHDVMTHEWASGRTRYERVAALGMRPRRVPLVSVADGIEAGRLSIRQAVFDARGCEHGLDGIRSYRRRWNAALQQFEAEPVKDWAEHIGSAFRYTALSWRDAPAKAAAEPRTSREEAEEFLRERRLAREKALDKGLTR